MAEYIEKQAVMDKFAEVVATSNHSDFQRAPTWNNAVDIIENFPPADVRPVVRGRWVYGIVRDDIPIPLECSVCEWQVTRRTNFCPHCGADMRGGDAE